MRSVVPPGDVNGHAARTVGGNPLAHLRTVNGHDTSRTTLALFSASGFSGELEAEAASSNGAVLLAGLDRLYGLSPGT